MNYDIFCTKDEFVEVVHETSLESPVYGVVHYWPNHFYDFLDLTRFSQFVAAPNASDMIIRTAELELDRAPKDFFVRPTVDGMVHVTIPRILEDRILLCVNAGIRPEDTAPSLPNPKALFCSIRRRFNAIRRRPLVWSHTGEVSKGWGYTEGALQLFDKGIAFAEEHGAIHTLVPGERCPHLDPSRIKIGS